MYHSPKCHLISYLSVEPDIFISWEGPGQLGPDDANDVAKHWHENEATIESEDETSATRSPDGILETIETS